MTRLLARVIPQILTLTIFAGLFPRASAQEIFREFNLNASRPDSTHFMEIDPKATYDFTRPGLEWACTSNAIRPTPLPST